MVGIEQAIIFRYVTFAELKKKLERMFTRSAASTMLYEAGCECGKRSASRAAKESGKSGGNLLEEIRKIKRKENWCRVDFNGFDVGKRTGLVVVNDSFEALGYGSSKNPVCHFLRGYFSGILSYVCGGDVVLNETKCIAKGDHYCEFQAVAK